MFNASSPGAAAFLLACLVARPIPRYMTIPASPRRIQLRRRGLLLLLLRRRRRSEARQLHRPPDQGCMERAICPLLRSPPRHK
nr:hypothetical protein SEVIR_3G003250v2 [Setaria viridis]